MLRATGAGCAGLSGARFAAMAPDGTTSFERKMTTNRERSIVSHRWDFSRFRFMVTLPGYCDHRIMPALLSLGTILHQVAGGYPRKCGNFLPRSPHFEP